MIDKSREEIELGLRQVPKGRNNECNRGNAMRLNGDNEKDIILNLVYRRGATETEACEDLKRSDREWARSSNDGGRDTNFQRNIYS